MRLKAPPRRGWLARSRSLGRLAGLLVVALALVAAGAWLRGTGWFGEAQRVVTEGLRSVPYLLDRMLADPTRITLDIEHLHVQKLAAKRDEALRVGHLLTGDEDFVPATLRVTAVDQELVGPLRVKVRLKGDVIDHLEGSKWSFRVHIRGDDTALGMKRFSLHHPRTRNYLAEWAYQRALRREGVLALRYDFVAVTVNGRDLGIYALEEHFEKRLIESNRRREGPIVRFNEDMFWREKAQQEIPFPESRRNRSGDYSSSEVDGIQTAALLADPALREQFVAAAGMLERFRGGELRTSEVFDVDLLARYYAVTDLFGAEHGARWHNARFYYNPVTTRLEPIGFDGDAGGPCFAPCGVLEGAYVGAEREPPLEAYWARLFSDPVFFRAYVRELLRVSVPAYPEALLGELREEMASALAVLHVEFPEVSFDEKTLFDNQRYLASVLSPVRAIHGWARPAGDRSVELELGVVQVMPVEVHGVTLAGRRIAVFDEPVMLPGRLDGVPVQYRRVTVELPGGLAAADALAGLEVDHSIFGTAARRSQTMLPWPRALAWTGPGAGMPGPSDLTGLPFLQVDEQQRRIRFRRGAFVLEQDLVIPPGYVLSAGEGTSLDLVQSAVIVSHSPLELTGSREDPILIGSSDGTGQGLAVLGAGARSVLSGVVFRGLRAPERPGWKLTGAVTFYESPVRMDGVRFETIRAEDALNVVRAPFDLERCLFVDIGSDALDGDFCADSVIASCAFRGCGNDAIDLSGSRVSIRDVEVLRAGDKGLSAGENSEVEVRVLTVLDSEIGVASKDLSHIVVHHPRIVRCKVGFAVYRKKPEFGPSRITAHGIHMEETEVPFMVERGSSMQHGSLTIEPAFDAVESLLYGAQYGKSSR